MVRDIITHFSPNVEDRPHMTIPIKAIQKLGLKATNRRPACTECKSSCC